jgi:uncharacterized protein (DUF305 family)
MNTRTIVIGAVVIAVALGAFAYTRFQRDSIDTMKSMDHSTTGTPAEASASSKAYEAVMASMMKDMMTPSTGKPDLDFMQGMIPHHQGAIDMAKVVLQYGKDPEVRTLAENVVKTQESEIAFMNEWLGKTDKSALPASPDATKANEQAMAVMMKDMMVPYSGDADVDFVKGMIPHHQGAIDMAKVALQYAKNPDVLKLAGDIVKAQEDEIAFMTTWLAKHGK